MDNFQLPFNPFENMDLWTIILTKGGRENLKRMFGFEPASEAKLADDLQYVTCCHYEVCGGLVARNGHCCKCNQQFVALIRCPVCGWKHGVLNANKFSFTCWYCESPVADS